MREAAKDRISNLPDSLIHHILAFLHISDCARASVLSRRWNYIWTTIPTLYLRRRYPGSSPFPSPYETEKFMDFVDGTLHRRNSSNVDKFTLTWALHLNETRLHSWITNVIRGKVKVLKLYLRQEQLSYIPISLYTCESLTTLELGGVLHTFTFPKRISFPRLKRLKLWGFRFSNECLNGFSNFPVLEELILQKCEFRLRNFCVSIPTLKLLKIHAWEPTDVLLDSNNVAKENVLSSFPALVEAVVQHSSKEDVAAVNQLVRAIAHVKCLTLSDLILKAFRSAHSPSGNLLTFHNVKMLRVSEDLTTDQELIAFLNAVPNLESLVFTKLNFIEEDSDTDDEEDRDEEDSDEEDSDEEDDDEEDSDEEDDDKENDSLTLDIVTNGCLFPHLKSASFQKFVGDPRELRWVKLILKTAKALQMVTIGCKAKREKDFVAEIQSYPRASPGCVIQLQILVKVPIPV